MNSAADRLEQIALYSDVIECDAALLRAAAELVRACEASRSGPNLSKCDDVIYALVKLQEVAKP